MDFNRQVNLILVRNPKLSIFQCLTMNIFYWKVIADFMIQQMDEFTMMSGKTVHSLTNPRVLRDLIHLTFINVRLSYISILILYN